MKTAKWLASSVILFIFMRSLMVLSAPRYENTSEDEHNQRLLSRSKRFSMNEYMVIALSMFNAFVFFYNNIDTFFPSVLRSRLTTTSNSNQNVIIANQQPSFATPDQSQLSLPSDNVSSEQSAQDRLDMINGVAEMLIAGKITTNQVPEDIRWEVVQYLNDKMQEQQRDIGIQNPTPSQSVINETDFTLVNPEDEVLSRQKRQFPVFGFLSFLMLLVNSVLLINENININNK